MTCLTDLEASVDAHVAAVAAALGTTAPSGAPGTLPFPRQILMVDDIVFHAAGILPQTGASATSQAVLAIGGRPSPSSKVDKGHIIFAETAAIRTPHWNEAAARITLWLDLRLLPIVLEQARHSERYLWIGAFGNGHIYSDLHSRP